MRQKVIESRLMLKEVKLSLDGVLTLTSFGETNLLAECLSPT